MSANMRDARKTEKKMLNVKLGPHRAKETKLKTVTL